MRTDIYAARNAQAFDRIRAAIAQLAGIEAFADVPALLDAAKHKDREAATLFEREAFAEIIDRLVAFVLTSPPVDADGDDGQEGDGADDDNDDSAGDGDEGEGDDGDTNVGADDGQAPAAAAAAATPRRRGGANKAKAS